MISKYSVIQFSPDALSGECINVGVIAFDEKKVRARFLSDWTRVRRFAGEDIGFLKDFAQEVSHASAPQGGLTGIRLSPELDEQLITRMATKWHNSIQLTTPRTSTKSVDELLDDASARFLKQVRREARDYRDRRDAANIARVATREALEKRVGKAHVSEFLHPQAEIWGKYEPHVFDSVVSNGRKYFALQGVSFELPEARELKQLVDAVAFQVFDTKESYKELPIGILALPPKPRGPAHAKKTYDQARRAYEGLSARVMTEGELNDWMREQMRQVPSEEQLV